MSPLIVLDLRRKTQENTIRFLFVSGFLGKEEG